MKDLVEYLARALVANPDAVEVLEYETSEGLVLELRVEEEDRGVLIGRKGRTAAALRLLVSAVAARAQKRVNLEIVD